MGRKETGLGRSSGIHSVFRATMYTVHDGFARQLGAIEEDEETGGAQRQKGLGQASFVLKRWDRAGGRPAEKGKDNKLKLMIHTPALDIEKKRRRFLMLLAGGGPAGSRGRNTK